MSKLVPRRTIDAIRNAVDVAMDVIGIDCTLYIPTNVSFDIANKLDVYSIPADLTYLSYSALVYLNWSPNVYKLKKLGLFTEGRLPILARFGNKATPLTGSNAGTAIEVDIPIRSYFRMSPEFVPSDYAGTEEFEIVNEAIDGMHDAILTKMFSVAPRRVKQS